MVKINQSNESVHTPQQNIVPTSKDTRTEAFKNLLDKALDKTGSSKMDTSFTRALDEIPSKNLPFISVADDISNRTDQLLKKLDMYSSRLKDTNISLRNIAPVLEDIKTHAERLLEDANMNPDMDSQLKRIAEEVAITANIEYFKFQRGDYLS
jgi:hypothetical protein